MRADEAGSTSDHDLHVQYRLWMRLGASECRRSWPAEGLVRAKRQSPGTRFERSTTSIGISRSVLEPRPGSYRSVGSWTAMGFAPIRGGGNRRSHHLMPASSLLQ